MPSGIIVLPCGLGCVCSYCLVVEYIYTVGIYIYRGDILYTVGYIYTVGIYYIPWDIYIPWGYIYTVGI